MPLPENTSQQRQLAKRYEACFRAYGKGLALHAGGRSLKEDGVEVYAAPTQNVFNAHLPRACAQKHLKHRFAQTLRLGAQQPSGLGILVGPSASQEGWADLFAAQKIRCGYWVPFMYRDLSQPIPPNPKIPGIHMTKLTDFCVFQEQPHPYIGKISTPHRIAELSYAEKLCGMGKAIQFIAWHDKLPVGGATVFLHRGAAAVFNVGVLEAFRHRKIGGTLMLESLRAAREAAADCAVLSAASKAVPVYERVGFRDVGHYGSYYVGKARLQRLVESLDSEQLHS